MSRMARICLQISITFAGDEEKGTEINEMWEQQHINSIIGEYAHEPTHSRLCICKICRTGKLECVCGNIQFEFLGASTAQQMFAVCDCDGRSKPCLYWIRPMLCVQCIRNCKMSAFNMILHIIFWHHQSGERERRSGNEANSSALNYIEIFLLNRIELNVMAKEEMTTKMIESTMKIEFIEKFM